jgi:hypothetical protein
MKPSTPLVNGLQQCLRQRSVFNPGQKLHNFCLSMNWLPWPLIPKRLWPEIKFKEKRAITFEEHRRIGDVKVTVFFGPSSSPPFTDKLSARHWESGLLGCHCDDRR